MFAPEEFLEPHLQLQRPLTTLSAPMCQPIRQVGSCILGIILSCSLAGVWQTLSVKGPTVNILGFADHTVCLNSTVSRGARARGHMKMNGQPVWQETFRHGQRVWVWPTGYTWPSPAYTNVGLHLGISAAHFHMRVVRGPV